MPNGAPLYIEFQFCVDAFPFPPTSNWGALVTVISAVEYPHSAFNLYLCPKSNGINNCVPGSVPPDNLNDNAVAVVSARVCAYDVRLVAHCIDSWVRYCEHLKLQSKTASLLLLLAKVALA